MYEVTFNRNAKYGKNVYRAGDSLSVKEYEYEELLTAGVIDETDRVKEKDKPKAAPKKKSGD